MTHGLRRELRLSDLVLLNTAAVVGIRNLSVAAHTGLGSIVLWISAALLFFLPSALVVAGLSRLSPAEGGLYVWTRDAFGPWHGFLCGASYIISVLFLLPTLLLSGLTMAAAALGFAQDKWLIVALSLVFLWGILFANLVGVSVAKWVSDAGGIATALVGALLLAAAWTAWRRGVFATTGSFLPRLDWQKLNLWSQIALAFTGLELGGIMAEEIRDPARIIPQAAWISSLTVSAFYIGGTFGLLALLPADQVDILSGLVQAGQAASARLGWTGFSPILALLVMVAAAGAFGSWLGGCARLPFVIGLDEYLPPALARLHPRWGTPYLALLGEGVFCTFFLLVMTLGENLRPAYQLLLDLTAASTMIPFLYLFATAWKNSLRLSAFCGLVVTSLTFALAFVPPEGADPWRHEVKLVVGCAAVIWLCRINYRYALSRRRA